MINFFSRRQAALTFDDVRLETGCPIFAPFDVDYSGRFTRNVPLLAPIIGAAMSTVVGARMAIALAKCGGIGSIPRSLAPEDQAHAAARVKHHQHGFIDEPIVAYADESVATLLQRRQAKGWEFDSFPVLDKQGILVGLMTHHNFKRCDDHSLLVGHEMTKVVDLVAAMEGISRERAFATLRECDKNVLPVVRRNGTLAGIYIFSDLKRILTENTKHNIDNQGRLRVAGAIGVGEEAMLRAELLVEKGVDVLHIDMAHGNQQPVFDTLKAVKTKFRDQVDVAAGNVSNAAGAHALVQWGADGVIVGQGGGAICTTRRVTGIGKPQVSAVWECAQAVLGSGVAICSDGGIRDSGDITIALAVGAHSVMVGNLIAGTDEAPGDKRFHDGRYVKDFYGMGSRRAMTESPGSRQRYLNTQGVLVPEGIEALVPYKGPVGDILEQHLGGVRKGFHYAGARTLQELHKTATLFQVTSAGLHESYPHDVISIPQGTYPQWES